MLAGIAVFIALEEIYTCFSLQLYFLCDSQFPSSLRHSHPLVSTSLREFWSVRWNPVINRLFKEGIFLPLQRYGYGSFVCMVVAFGGSAALHWFPVMIGGYHQQSTTYNNSFNMGVFFLIHGTLVYFSRFFFCRVKFRTSKEKNHWDQGTSFMRDISLDTACWVSELMICTTYVCGMYSVILFFHGDGSNDGDLNVNDELSDTVMLRVICFATLAVVSFCISCVFMYLKVIPDTYVIEESSSRMILLVQWIVTISIIIITVPLFSVPIMSMFDEVYAESIFAGKALEGIAKMIF